MQGVSIPIRMSWTAGGFKLEGLVFLVNPTSTVFLQRATVSFQVEQINKISLSGRGVLSY